ncbi:hypothetical protein EMCRGX_G014309 [Ephydatia muelleri]|eukprot:Em0005g1596a
MAENLASLVTRLETVTAKLESLASRGGGAGGGSSAAADVLAEFVEEYDNQILGGKLKEYLALSDKIGGDVSLQAKLVQQVFQEQRKYLLLASKYKLPKPDLLEKAVKHLSDLIGSAQDFCEKRRTSKQFNHLMAVKEGIAAVGWVRVAPKPAPYIKEMADQSQFYSNRVLKDFKGQDETHVEWVKAFTGTIKSLEEYVKQYHTTGLVWNGTGADFTGTAPPPPPPAGAGPPPPPPPAAAGPPPPPPPAVQPQGHSSAQAAEPESDRGDLLAALNKGLDITSGLRKVTNDMKTYKNPALRASSVVKAEDKPAATSASKPSGATGTQAKKNPVCELVNDKKWTIEWQEGNKSIDLKVNSKQTVYIFKCNKSVVKVSGKCNSIAIDNCKHVAVVFDDVISAVEVVNSQSIQVQINGACPTVSIDKTDGCQVYLSKASLNAEIVTAKSSEMNICVPSTTTAGDFTEHALPEQYKTKWNGKAFVTNCTDINS